MLPKIGKIMMEQRPNFYVILELDPSIKDWSVIQAAIQKKRRFWSMQKNQGSPSARRKAERYLKYIPEMESLFKDSNGRKKEAKTAIQEKKQEKQTQLETLDQLIDMFHSSTVSSKEVKLLIQKTGKIFSEKEIEDRLKKQGIRLEKGSSKAKRKTRPKLEPSVVKGIRGELDTLKLASLYDFLNLNNTTHTLSTRSSPKSLYDRADTIYKELSRIGKTDADSTLKMNLAGRAKSIFKDNTEKERYDNTLAVEVLAELENPLEIAGRNKFIETKELNSLLQLAKKLGVTEEDLAIEYIEDYAARRKWGLQKDTQIIRTKLLVCGFCNELADAPQEKYCKKCGQELIQPCPKCGEPTPTENTACSCCGCHTGDAPLVNALFKDAKRFVAAGDFDKAHAHLNRVLDYWPEWQSAIQEKKQVELRKRERTENLNEILSLIAAKKFETAESQLGHYLQHFGKEGIEKAKKQINEGLQLARNAFGLAERIRRAGKTEDAFDKYDEVLSYCVDFSPVLAVMASSPPPPPNNITTQWVGQTLRLNWKETKARGKICYRIIRKADGLPTNDKDGKIIAETYVSKVDDTDIKSGVPYFYGVFSIRAGVISTLFVGTGPHLKMDEVDKIEYKAGNKQISIKWQPPSGCLSVEVRRWEGKRSEGVRVIFSGNNLLDSGLQNGRRYRYLIVAKFRNPNDTTQTLFSKGKSIIAMPVAPPEPVLDLTARRKERLVFLTWTPPAGKVEVQIRQAQSIPAVEPGQILSVHQANHFGVPIPTSSDHTTQTTLTAQGRVFFVPLSIVSETAVIGRPVSVTTIDEVSNFISQRNGRSIILTWSWPTGATEVFLTYHNDYFPLAPTTNGAAKVRITRAEYERYNYWELRSATAKKHYFTIFVRDPTADIYSNGVKLLEAMGQEGTVQYYVNVKKRFLSRIPHSAWIEFISKDGKPLENIVVVLKNNFPPVSMDDGIVIAEADKLTFLGGKSQLSIPEQYLKHKGFIKVFFKDDLLAREVRLLPSAKEKLRLR